MTSIKYDHLQVMETITGKFNQYPLNNVGGVVETRTSVDKWLKLAKGHNSGKKHLSVDLGIIWSSSGHGNNNWKVSLKSTENCRVAETWLSVEKLPMGYNSGKNHSSMTSIKYYHLQVMGTITGKFHQNPLKTVGVAEKRLCLRMDGRNHKNW